MLRTARQKSEQMQKITMYNGILPEYLLETKEQQ